MVGGFWFAIFAAFKMSVKAVTFILRAHPHIKGAEAPAAPQKVPFPVVKGYIYYMFTCEVYMVACSPLCHYDL